MTRTEENIKIANKLYTCRRTLKSLFKEEYKEKMEWYKKVLNTIMVAEKLECLPAMVKAIEMIVDKPGGGVTSMWLMAAAVEIIEPEE
jgi:effector-binding domain-containing protein